MFTLTLEFVLDVKPSVSLCGLSDSVSLYPFDHGSFQIWPHASCKCNQYASTSKDKQNERGRFMKINEVLGNDCRVEIHRRECGSPDFSNFSFCFYF